MGLRQWLLEANENKGACNQAICKIESETAVSGKSTETVDSTCSPQRVDLPLEQAQDLPQVVSYDNYHLVLSGEELNMVIERIEITKEVSIDLETTSPNPMIAQIVGIALSPASHEAYYIPIGHRSAVFDSSKRLDPRYVLQKLKPIIEDETISKIGQNLKYEYIILERYGINLRGISCDAMIAAHMIDSSWRSYSLDKLAMRYLGIEPSRQIENCRWYKIPKAWVKVRKPGKPRGKSINGIVEIRIPKIHTL